MAAACGPGGAFGTSPAGLRTFAVSSGVLCTLQAAVDPLTGTLRGDPSDAELLWLEAPDGSRRSVVWPATVRLQFTPAAEIYDNTGAFIAQDGDVMTFGQIPVGSAAGTHDDPYVLDGLWEGGRCYTQAE